MATFHVKVLTTERNFFEDDVDQLVVRTSTGDVGILPNHVPYTASLGVGALTILKDGTTRIAAISGGFMEVSKEGTVILARTCEWADDIDLSRAKQAAEQARAKLEQKESDIEHDIAQVKLKKAINRIRIAGDR